MADFNDSFTGAAGPLLSHVSDTGQGWLAPGDTDFSLNGSGAVYFSGTHRDGYLPYSAWTPPGANYSVKITVGPDYRAIATTCAIGPVIRCSGPAGTESYYRFDVFDGGSGSDVLYVTRVIGGVLATLVSSINLPARVQSGDAIEIRAIGISPVVIYGWVNSTQVVTFTDASASAVTAVGSAGIYLSASGTGTNVITHLWAGVPKNGPGAKRRGGAASMRARLAGPTLDFRLPE